MIRSSFLAAVLAGGMVPMSALAAVPGASTLRAVAADDHVRVVVRSRFDGSFGKHSDEVRATLDAKTNAAVADSKISDAWTVHVDVHVFKPGTYEFEVFAKKEGAPPTNPIQDRCDMCLVDDLVARVNADIVEQLAAIEKFEASAAAAPPFVEASEPQPSLAPVQADPPPTEDRKPNTVALKATWIGLGSVGLGVIISGVVLAALPDKKSSPTSEIARERSTRQPGFALLGLGGALLIGSIAVLVIERQKSKRLSFAPEFGPRHAGLSVGGRF